MFGADQSPDQLPLFVGEGFENERNVSRMKIIDECGDLVFMLALQEPFDQIRLMVAILLLYQVIDRLVVVQELLHAGERELRVFRIKPSNRGGRIGSVLRHEILPIQPLSAPIMQ